MRSARTTASTTRATRATRTRAASLKASRLLAAWDSLLGWQRGELYLSSAQRIARRAYLTANGISAPSALVSVGR